MGSLEASDTQWTATEALYAGPYWWHVATHDRITRSGTRYSQALPFTVAELVRLTRVRITRDSHARIPDKLNIDVRWVTNDRSSVAEAVVISGRRRVGRFSRLVAEYAPLDPQRVYWTWRRPRGVRTGTRLTVLVSVRGGAASPQCAASFERPKRAFLTGWSCLRTPAQRTPGSTSRLPQVGVVDRPDLPALRRASALRAGQIERNSLRLWHPEDDPSRGLQGAYKGPKRLGTCSWRKAA
jgi:hypothetical protein